MADSKGQRFHADRWLHHTVTWLKDTGLSVKNVRTALNHLETTGEVAVNRHPKFSVVEIKNYNVYQTDGTVTGSQVAVQPASNRQSTGNNRRREESKKERK